MVKKRDPEKLQSFRKNLTEENKFVLKKSLSFFFFLLKNINLASNKSQTNASMGYYASYCLLSKQKIKVLKILNTLERSFSSFFSIFYCMSAMFLNFEPSLYLISSSISDKTRKNVVTM